MVRLLFPSCTIGFSRDTLCVNILQYTPTFSPFPLCFSCTFMNASPCRALHRYIKFTPPQNESETHLMQNTYHKFTLNIPLLASHVNTSENLQHFCFGSLLGQSRFSISFFSFFLNCYVLFNCILASDNSYLHSFEKCIGNFFLFIVYCTTVTQE